MTTARVTGNSEGIDPAAVQTRTIRTLVVSQAVGAVGVTIGVATASLLARDISGSESMAGLAQTFRVLGTAAAAFLLARLMRARGRRIGLVTGYLLGAAGALLAVVAGVVDSMLVLLLGAVLPGATTAANSGSATRPPTSRRRSTGPAPCPSSSGPRPSERSPAPTSPESVRRSPGPWASPS
ncbi:hypothetical protein [Nocardioides sp. B-3]|uniref:hypothetical protein n=1 Tax=Nocardioides sp. B-3 TaxID=2895565 RepID=UPI00215216F1|nr:hypothetical protein [Nocardioides sp. B-3]UUZ59305.1 hypothetical protein LP418_26195 [Nocardioides sp. B-3]